MVCAGNQCDQFVSVLDINAGIIDGFLLKLANGIIKILFAFRIDKLIELSTSQQRTIEKLVSLIK